MLACRSELLAYAQFSCVYISGSETEFRINSTRQREREENAMETNLAEQGGADWLASLLLLLGCSEREGERAAIGGWWGGLIGAVVEFGEETDLIDECICGQFYWNHHDTENPNGGTSHYLRTFDEFHLEQKVA